MSISCGSCEAKAGYVEVYLTLLIRTVRHLSARRVGWLQRGLCLGERGCVPYEDVYGTLGVANEQLGADSL